MGFDDCLLLLLIVLTMIEASDDSRADLEVQPKRGVTSLHSVTVAHTSIIRYE